MFSEVQDQGNEGLLSHKYLDNQNHKGLCNGPLLAITQNVCLWHYSVGFTFKDEILHQSYTGYDFNPN